MASTTVSEFLKDFDDADRAAWVYQATGTELAALRASAIAGDQVLGSALVTADEGARALLRAAGDVAANAARATVEADYRAIKAT